MAGRFDDDVVADLQCRFSEGETPTWEEFYEWIDDIQAGFDAHNHSGAGSGDGAAIPFSALSGLIEYENIRDKTGASAIVAAVVSNTALIAALQAGASDHETRISALENGFVGMVEDVITDELAAGQSIDTAIDSLVGDHAALVTNTHGIATINGNFRGLAQIMTLVEGYGYQTVSGLTAAVEAVIDDELGAGQSIDNAIDSLVSGHADLSTNTHGVATINGNFRGLAQIMTLVEGYGYLVASGLTAAVEGIIDDELGAGQSIDNAIDTLVGAHSDAIRQVHGVGTDIVADSSDILALDGRLDTIELDYLVASDLSTHAGKSTGVHGAGTDYLVADDVTDALDGRIEDIEDDYTTAQQAWNEGWDAGEGLITEHTDLCSNWNES